NGVGQSHASGRHRHRAQESAPVDALVLFVAHGENSVVDCLTSRSKIRLPLSQMVCSWAPVLAAASVGRLLLEGVDRPRGDYNRGLSGSPPSDSGVRESGRSAESGRVRALSAPEELSPFHPFCSVFLWLPLLLRHTIEAGHYPPAFGDLPMTFPCRLTVALLLAVLSISRTRAEEPAPAA